MSASRNNIPPRMREIWAKTGGRCHFCGDRVSLRKRGYHHGRADGSWEIDHVTQAAKGGRSGIENYLPACTGCNRLRWHRNGAQIRRLLILGILASQEIQKRTDVGHELVRLEDARNRQNRYRHKTKTYVKRNRLTDPVLIDQRRQEDTQLLEQYLRKRRTRSFTARELSKGTGVGKSRIRRLLELSRKVDIDDGSQPILFKIRPPKRTRKSKSR
jgi:hypothetical protein